MKELIKEYINKIAGTYRIDKVYLFGSVARNDANNNSDIDLVVVFDGKENLGDRFLDFMLDIQKKFNRKADIITEKMLNKNPYFKKMLKMIWKSFIVDDEITWSISNEKIPVLKENIRRIKEHLNQ